MADELKNPTEYMKVIDGQEATGGYSLTILRKEDNSLIDVSTLAGDITHYTSINDNPSKLTFFIQQDPKGILNNVQNGDMVMYRYQNIGIFMGYIFNIGQDATKMFKITSYDQTRYLKNEDYYVVNGGGKKMTVSQIFEDICIKNQLNYAVKVNIDFVPPPKIYAGKTLYSILRECLTLAENDAWNKNKDNATKYIIRDNYGTLELTSVDELKTNIIIGEQSLLSSFQYEISIDKGTYNSFKILKKVNVESEKKKGERQKKDKNTIVYQTPKVSYQDKWGLLQKVVEADENMNEAQVSEYGENLLKSYCRETRTLSLSAIGLLGMNAGVYFSFDLSDLNVDNLGMYILEATHKYSADFHTMDLQVNANDMGKYFK